MLERAGARRAGAPAREARTARRAGTRGGLDAGAGRPAPARATCAPARRAGRAGGAAVAAGSLACRRQLRGHDTSLRARDHVLIGRSARQVQVDCIPLAGTPRTRVGRTGHCDRRRVAPPRSESGCLHRPFGQLGRARDPGAGRGGARRSRCAGRRWCRRRSSGSG